MNEADLKIEAGYPHSSGGQCVGIVSTTVKITHVPTGLSASCGTERSQMKNKNIALSMIEWGLAEIGWREQ